MTATDELRRMLDERGVEWSGIGDHTVLWCRRDAKYANYDAQASDWGDKLMLSWACTPEQAIEATLGRGTCSIRGGECDQCGAYIHRDAVLFWVPVEGMRTVESRDVSYCPNCGRRVVAGDA